MVLQPDDRILLINLPLYKKGIVLHLCAQSARKTTCKTLKKTVFCQLLANSSQFKKCVYILVLLCTRWLDIPLKS